MIAFAFCLLLSSAVAESVVTSGDSGAPFSATGHQKQSSLVAVSLADGTCVAGRLVWREGDRRPWLRVAGLSTVLMRPLSADQVVTIAPFVLRPTASRGRDDSKTHGLNPLSDAEMAHRLLFGEP